MQKLSWLLRLLLLAVCLYAGHLLMAKTHWHEALAHINDVSMPTLLLAILCVCASYIALIGYDYLGVRFLAQKVPIMHIAMAATLANAVSNSLGFAVFSGGAVRMRCYQPLGMAPMVVAKLSLFCTATFLLGLALAASLGMVWAPAYFEAVMPAFGQYLSYLGISIICLCGALPLLAKRYSQLSLFGKSWVLPSPNIILGQFVVGAVDILATAAVLYVLLPDAPGLHFLAFVTLFSAALWLGLVSHVPAGLGVFETVMLAGLAPFVPAGQVLGALLLYRFLYYVVPFVMALLVLLWRETQATFKTRLALPLGFVPGLLSVLVALAGLILLFSGSTPAIGARLEWLAQYLPLSFIESSHLLASVIGFMLLLVARGLFYRLDSAWQLSILLMLLGVVASLAKGLDYEEATVLLALILLTLAARGHFYRPGRLQLLTLSWHWLLMILAAIAVSSWLLFFAYKHVEYQNFLWWQFELSADVSRSLRSQMLVAVLLLLLLVYQGLRPRQPRLPMPDMVALNKARQITLSSKSTHGFLALTGDKALLFSQNQQAFVMLGQTRRMLIAMGDPVGPEQEWPELIWRAREIADTHRLGLAFYQVGGAGVGAYLDAGLSLVKLGEEAMVPLTDFSLEGSRYKSLRQAISKGQRQGWHFVVLSVAEVMDYEPQLAAVSRAWLARKNTGEKHFSLGAYSADYVRHFSVAAIFADDHVNGKKIIAFANLWLLEDKTECSIDLMRYNPDSSHGVMDYLFACIMSWAKDAGYTHFNLGMAPLSGLPRHRLASSWAKLGGYVYGHGENFYNFRGVHSFKEKYHPHWQPRYLALVGGSVLGTLAQVTLLISDGWRGLFK